MKTSNAVAWVVAVALGTLLIAAPVSAAPGQAKTGKHSTATAGPVDINSATKAQLESLPGIGAATAKKIIAGRPYATVADLSKAGVSAATITKITPLVTVGAASVPAPPATPAAATTPAAAQTPATATRQVTTSPAVPPPAAGMVWVNTETRVFHREGDKFYGNTKHGKYMTEADALKAGYREAKVSGGSKKK